MSDFILKINNQELNLNKPKVMGILNLTPDSFYDGGKFNSEKLALERTEKMLSEGADIIDVGAFSSRPGSKEITPFEEYDRLLAPLQALKKEFTNCIFSIDTYRCSIVLKLYDKIGDFIVNDISGGLKDEGIFDVCGGLNLPYICMHMQGSPENMQEKPQYKDLIKEQKDFFTTQISAAKKANVPQVIIDPGLGFGKTVEHNFQILKNLKEYKDFRKPILIGLSRKSMIQKTLNVSVNEALNGTTALNMVSLMNGANILRVHDVKEAVQCVKLHEQLKY